MWGEKFWTIDNFQARRAFFFFYPVYLKVLLVFIKANISKPSALLFESMHYLILCDLSIDFSQ